MAADAGAHESQSLSPAPRGRYPLLPLATVARSRPELGAGARGGLGVSKHLKSSRGRISNRGPLPRFIGLIPTGKADDGVIAFSSITELLVALFLIWARWVVKILYEPRKVTFTATEDLSEVIGWPDFEVLLDGGEIEFVNAKYSDASMREEERSQLERFDAHCRAHAQRHRVVFRDALEKNGFIETISLLRPYGLLEFPAPVIAGAMAILGGLPATHLEGWQERAREALLPLDLVYHLLYRQQLPLAYRPLVHTGLRKCRD